MNIQYFPKLSVILIVFLAVFSTASVAIAAGSAHYQRVDDVDFYLAVIPAEITRGRSALSEKFKAHETSYHIIISLFDSSTGNRITDAAVNAIVSRSGGMVKQNKTLEPMLIMDASSYGNYFLMSEPGKYHLHFKVQTPSRKYEITSDFFFNTQ